jgi:hypothetical protein
MINKMIYSNKSKFTGSKLYYISGDVYTWSLYSKEFLKIRLSPNG